MAELGVGQVVGDDFEILKPLEKGGMGAVYLALQRSTGRQRALKVMHAEIVSDPLQRGRFAQEARVASQIDSDHVVEVVAAGVDPTQGFPWLVMELLDGEELGKRVDRGDHLTPDERVEALAQLFHGMARAHAAGIVHRDLKPGNLFLARARRAGVPFTLKILDFGIAKLLDDAKTHATTQALGTPLWMAPEQSDQTSVVSPATDVWALGLITFWVLTGHHYWLAAQNPAATLTGLLREILVEPMPSASTRAAELGVTVPPGFDEWFAACTTRDPKLRIANAESAWQYLAPVLPSAPSASSLAFGRTEAPATPGRVLVATATSAVAPIVATSGPSALAPAHYAESPALAPSHQDSLHHGVQSGHGYFYPVVYPFSEPGCAPQLWWVALINYIPGINLLLLRGFRLELTKRVLADQTPLFPPPAHMGSFLFQGALLWAMTALYLVPPLFLMAFTGLKGLTGFLGDLMTLAGIVLGLTNVSLWDFVVRELWSTFLAAMIDSVWVILSLPLYRAAMIHYSVTGNVGAFFAIHTNIGFIVRHARKFANLYLFSFILNSMIALVGLVMASTLVGALFIPLFALPVYYWTTGYEYGLLAKVFAQDLANPATARGQLRWLLLPAALALMVHACAPDPLARPDLDTLAAGAVPTGACGAPFVSRATPRGAGVDVSAQTQSPASNRNLVPSVRSTPAPAPTARASASPGMDAAQGELHEVEVLVTAYYADLSSPDFDASRHFSPQIERYITMRNTTPAALNAYINGGFRTQFKNPSFSYEAGTLEREAPNTYVYAEHSEYYLVAKKRLISQRYKVRIRTVGDKLTFYHQFEKLPNTPSP